MRGVRRGARLFSACKLTPSPYRLPGHASSRPHEVIVLWRSSRSRLCRLYAPDDTDDLRSGERSDAGQLADPNIAYANGGLVPEHTLATPAFMAWNVRCCPTDVEANPIVRSDPATITAAASIFQRKPSVKPAVEATSRIHDCDGWA
jgi:hypothetical protein